MTPFNTGEPHTPVLEQALETPWRELTYVAFDTETTGRYPLEAEVCEVAAVKWKNGGIVDRYETLIKPSRPMGAEVIAIHGITNEMVQTAPRMSEKIAEFHSFVAGAVLVAHHAPFDLGFLSIEFEKAGLPLPEMPILCSSLLARKLFPESENHRLQTLIKFFSLNQGAAHRALDDAIACLEVGIRCLEKTDGVSSATPQLSLDLKPETPLRTAADVQGGPLTWKRFSMRELEANTVGKALIEAVQAQSIIEIGYGAGSAPGKKRRVHPIGLVRSLDGDFLQAYDEQDQRGKRYYVEKITTVERV